jgi:hypothetical protein
LEDEQPPSLDSGDGEVTIGAFHGPEPAPIRRVLFRDPDGNVAEQIVSEEAWQQHQKLKAQGYSFVATTSRSETRAVKAEARRAKRRAARQRRRGGP